MASSVRALFTLNSVLILSLGLAPACGGLASEDGDSTTGATDTGDGDGGACGLEFEGGAPGTFATWTVVNDREVPIYLPGTKETCTIEPLSVFEGETRVFWHDGSYVPTCTELTSVAGCSWGCGDGSTLGIKLEPGASWEFVFGLYGWTAATLDAACVAGTQCEVGSECYVGRAFTEVPLSVHIPVTENCNFAGSCECEGDACQFAFGDLNLPLSDAEDLTFEYDGAIEGATFSIQ